MTKKRQCVKLTTWGSAKPTMQAQPRRWRQKAYSKYSSEVRKPINYSMHSIIGDGDTKAYNVVQSVYGDKVDTVKKECVGHVQKRVGTNKIRPITHFARLVAFVTAIFCSSKYSVSFVLSR